MAYALMNKGITRPPKGKRYVHRRVVLRPVGADGSAVATEQVRLPCAARLVALSIDYQNQPATTDLLIKADTTNGVTIFTRANSATDLAQTAIAAPGLHSTRTTVVDQGIHQGAGGFPVRGGVFIDVAQGDGQTSGDEQIIVDLFFRLCTFAQITLVAQSGADGTGAVTRTVDLQGAGVLAAVALDFQNMPVTTDVLIKADDTNGATLFDSTSSLTDVAPTALVSTAVDEGGAATADTDAGEGGLAFKRGLFIDVAQADIFTSGDEKIIAELWIDE
jgi:hypothetical protein